MTAETIHTCSYYCERPECIRAQRDELAARMTAETSNARGEWVLVPRNPTEAMIDAWRDAPDIWEDAYTAMLAAAPRPPSAPVGVEAIAAEIRASLGRGATVCTRRRWAIELEALAQQQGGAE